MADESKESDDPLLGPLYEDVWQCCEHLDSSDSQFTRRVLIRSSFAFFEGVTNSLRMMATSWLTSGRSQLDVQSAQTLTLLQEDVPRPDRTGKISYETNRTPFLNYFAFVLRTSAEHFAIDAAGFFADNGWNNLQIALRARHRLTHPKRAQDANVTDDEITATRDAHRWVFNCYIKIAQGMAKRQVELAQQWVELEAKASELEARSRAVPLSSKQT